MINDTTTYRAVQAVAPGRPSDREAVRNGHGSTERAFYSKFPALEPRKPGLSTSLSNPRRVAKCKKLDGRSDAAAVSG